MSPETDVVIGPDAGVQLRGNMLRHEFGQNLYLALHRLGDKVRLAELCLLYTSPSPRDEL